MRKRYSYTGGGLYPRGSRLDLTGARYDFAKGFVTVDAADDHLADCFAEGTVSLGERPAIEGYFIRGTMLRRYKITLRAE